MFLLFIVAYVGDTCSAHLNTHFSTNRAQSEISVYMHIYELLPVIQSVYELLRACICCSVVTLLLSADIKSIVDVHGAQLSVDCQKMSL